jgi:hypothetical protein
MPKCHTVDPEKAKKLLGEAAVAARIAVAVAAVAARVAVAVAAASIKLAAACWLRPRR